MTLRRVGMVAVAASALAFLCALQLVALLRAPPAFYPATIEVPLRAGASIVLGQQELAAPDAESRHLAVRRDASGAWLVRNVSAVSALRLLRGRAEQRTGATALRQGQTFQLGATIFSVDGAGSSDLAFSAAGQHWRYDGATLWRGGAAQPPCPDSRFGARALAAWNRLAPVALTLARPLVFGGNLHCGNRLGLGGIDGGAALASRAEHGIVLASAVQAALLVDGALLAETEYSLAGVTGLLAGRTRLSVAIDGDSLHLRPLSHVALFMAPQAELPAPLAWRWQQRAAWALPPAAVGPAALLLLGALGAAIFKALGGSAAWTWRVAGLLIAAAGSVALFLQRAGYAPGIGISLLLAWAALWYLLLAPGKLHLVTAAAVLLLALGLLAQLELGLGGAESSWLRHVQKTACLLAIGAGLGVQPRLFRQAQRMSQAHLEWLLVVLATMALAALLLQVVFGDETGVFDIQPVEFAKLALTALTAHCLALGMGTQAAPGGIHRWLRLGAPALLFMVLLALALVEVDDFSPLILLLVWSTAMALAYALASRNVGLAALVGAAALMCVGGVAMLHSAAPQQVANWQFYGDRFLVWLDPATHPHTGQQMLAGARAIGAGGWWGSDGLLGFTSLGQHAGAAMRIAAVQDDFAPAFFLNRHGLAAALALWLLQALFIGALLQVAARAWAASVAARDFRRASVNRFFCFALCGGAAFILGHLLLSWGTNLAIFPIMGQPMSFLSAGGSHLLFFICPLLAVASFSAQSFEEN
ncbi:FtsW/RodA/SpoVE family cell cycle protein [Massilia sp. S19_KUP03_FR1]|uniref:FtsW/RodA/SpoVE family cell cycle protein n=1 Tax=Massilia sp. S19_KUP03_FR1 TaxID=3025503 RepID=UPI002FCD9D0C